uniref:ERF1_1 domain-containing protein n=1 Tax=Rhabditophanes sp. KR3021 TaxID=114890 RepID=A0AC35UC19_9BILA
MQVKYRKFERNGEGTIEATLSSDEDMWHFYNLIRAGDTVTSFTSRRVVKVNAKGQNESEVMKMTIALKVVKISFDATTCEMHLNGMNQTESKFIKNNQFHTLDILKDQKFLLYKEMWDVIDIKRLEEAKTSQDARADTAVVMMHEGVANLFLVSNNLTFNKATLNMPITGKRTGHASKKSAQMEKFHHDLATSFLKHVDFKVIKIVLIASASTYKVNFLKYLQQFAINRETPLKKDDLNKFVLVDAASGFKESLKDILNNPDIMSRVNKKKTQIEMDQMKEFEDLMLSDSDRAYYGPDDVFKIHQQGCIDKLLISDTWFRSFNLDVRKKYVNLVRDLEKNGKKVFIYSSQHVSGQQLDSYTGIAAILKYPFSNAEAYNQKYADPEVDNIINRVLAAHEN